MLTNPTLKQSTEGLDSKIDSGTLQQSNFSTSCKSMFGAACLLTELLTSQKVSHWSGGLYTWCPQNRPTYSGCHCDLRDGFQWSGLCLYFRLSPLWQHLKLCSSFTVHVLDTCLIFLHKKLFQCVKEYVSRSLPSFLPCASYFPSLQALRKTGLLTSDPRLRNCVHQMRQSTRDSIGIVMMDKKLFRRWKTLCMVM